MNDTAQNVQNDFGRVEYRVKPVTRYVITRYEKDGKGSSVSTRGEYDNPDVAWEVAYALCKQDHERFGYPIDDERIQYPRHPKEADAQPA
jgi:hypothetical protein